MQLLRLWYYLLRILKMACEGFFSFLFKIRWPAIKYLAFIKPHVSIMETASPLRVSIPSWRKKLNLLAHSRLKLLPIPLPPSIPGSCLKCSCQAANREQLSLKSGVVWEAIVHSFDFTLTSTLLSYLHLIIFNRQE